MSVKITVMGYEVPSRCVDIGGWLDIQRAKEGSIVNLGVLTRPFGGKGAFRGIEVSVHENTTGVIDVRATDPAYDVMANVDDLLKGDFDHKNLLLAVIYLVIKECLHQTTGLKILILSPIRPGASLGTSASVAVALIKAMVGKQLTNKKIAVLALRAEIEIMGGESGIQDQCSAAFPGAVKRINITDFPATSCRKIPISDKTRARLNDGMITVCFGSHNSSEIHRQVIARIDLEGSEILQPLRPLADMAEQAILNGDLKALGEVMKANTEAQRGLHPDLVSQEASVIIFLADKVCQAWGWKINGAGGDGSVTLLFSSREEAEKFYELCKKIHPTAGYDYLEHQLI